MRTDTNTISRLSYVCTRKSSMFRSAEVIIKTRWSRRLSLLTVRAKEATPTLSNCELRILRPCSHLRNRSYATRSNDINIVILPGSVSGQTSKLWAKEADINKTPPSYQISRFGDTPRSRTIPGHRAYSLSQSLRASLATKNPGIG